MTPIRSRGVDSHLHIFDPRYPFMDSPRYVPHPSQVGTGRQFMEVLRTHGLSHALLVGAAPYGGNNAPLLDAIRESKGRYKGIALIPDPSIPDAALERLHAGGIVGIRFNLAAGLDELQHPGAGCLLDRIADLGWFLDLHCEQDALLQALPALRKTRVKLLIDHCGRPYPHLGLDQPNFRCVLELAQDDRAHVKLSGPFRFSTGSAPYKDVDRYVAALVEAFGLERCVWGSDWPFVNVGERIDYGPQLACLQRWLPDPADRNVVLWETPARLFGFSDAHLHAAAA